MRAIGKAIVETAIAINIPLSFDLDGKAIRPDIVLKCSYGNDSIALIQWAHEYNQKYPLGKVVVLYNNTGWAAGWWEARAKNAEENLVKKYGFIPCRTESIGMEKLILKHNTWPNSMMKFCTTELKIWPTLSWLAENDPEGKATLVCGVRRCESHRRLLWPEFSKGSDKNEGRDEWAPLVEHTDEMRDELIVRAGWMPLPHRSRECRCVLANAADLKTWKEEDIQDIEKAEALLGEKKDLAGTDQRADVNRFMFRPSTKKGEPKGIREVVEWAHKVGVKENVETGCDSGFCTG